MQKKCFRDKEAFNCLFFFFLIILSYLIIFLVCLCVFVSSSNEKPLSRRARLAQLCTYLQERYKHLCRQDRAATRHSRYRYAFRKALLHAASKDPDCTAQLIQKLSKNSQTSAGCVEHGLRSVNTWTVYVCFHFNICIISFQFKVCSTTQVWKDNVYGNYERSKLQQRSFTIFTPLFSTYPLTYTLSKMNR